MWNINVLFFCIDYWYNIWFYWVVDYYVEIGIVFVVGKNVFIDGLMFVWNDFNIVK